MKQVLLAMGGNLKSPVGGPEQTIQDAFSSLSEGGIDVVAQSRLYQSPAFPAGSGPDYVNAAALCQSELPPLEILAQLHRVEQRYGRERLARWGARSLDIDLIGVGTLIYPDQKTYEAWQNLSLDQQQEQAPDGLILPHPRMQDRAFVLIPMVDVAPNWRHPVLGQTVLEMLSALPKADLDGVQPL